ncbi:MAG: NVEALA domain-containing protein [Prevotellaceae bacterium]|jgi:hypothetical protein|nr:NVEALA domain-containing protein [Prevotellaceae bacterium]
MNKKIIGAVIVTAVICVSGWNISRSKSDVALSDVALENVEALAGEYNGTWYCATDNSYKNYCNYTDSAHPCPCGF